MRHLPLLLIILISACSSLRPINREHPYQELNESTYQNFNGAYQVRSIDPSYRNLSYSLLQNEDYKPESGDYIKLEMVDKSRIKILLYQKDTVIESKINKGEFENGYFVLKRLVKFGVFMGPLTGFSEQKTRISLDPNNNLILDTTGSGCGFLIFIPIICSDTENYNLKFERIKQ